MLVSDGDWNLGTLNDESDGNYRMQHSLSKLNLTFDHVHVERQSRYHVAFHCYEDGSVPIVFRDSRNLPDNITEKLMEIADG